MQQITDQFEGTVQSIVIVGDWWTEPTNSEVEFVVTSNPMDLYAGRAFRVPAEAPLPQVGQQVTVTVTTWIEIQE